MFYDCLVLKCQTVKSHKAVKAHFPFNSKIMTQLSKDCEIFKSQKLYSVTLVQWFSNLFD